MLVHMWQKIKTAKFHRRHTFYTSRFWHSHKVSMQVFFHGTLESFHWFHHPLPNNPHLYHTPTDVFKTIPSSLVSRWMRYNWPEALEAKLLRHRPHVSGNLWKRKFFFTNTRIHTYQAYFPAVSGNFWKRSPEWKFFYPIRIRIRVDGRIRKFANTLTSFSWIQSSRRALSCVQINAAVINLHNQCFRDPNRCFWRIASFCILSWPSAVGSTSSSDIYMHQHTFSCLFQEI